MDVLEEKPVTLATVESILKKKEKEYKEGEIELSYEQRRALEHSSKFKHLNVKDSEKLGKELAGVGLDLSEERVVKIIDLMPETVDDVRAIFAKERFKYTEEDIKKITDLVAQYR
ncbi:MAG: RNA polymerase Rpb4 family protein [Candidatus Altiarchaeota archaeon]